MKLFKDTLYLLKVGLKSLFKNSAGNYDKKLSNLIVFILIPILIGILSFHKAFLVDNNLISDILTVISIFLAITLGVIFIVPEKLAQRLEFDKSPNESNKNNRKRYKKFCKLFIQRLTFVLILCVIMIMSTFLMKIFPINLSNVISSFVLTLFSLSVLSILKLVIDIYIFLMADIDDFN